MALDFCIKDNHDKIIVLMPIGLETFNNIIELSTTNPKFSLIPQKLKDYYEDVEFYIAKLTTFKSELENLYPFFQNDPKTSESIYLLLKLCVIALHLNKAISVIAD